MLLVLYPPLMMTEFFFCAREQQMKLKADQILVDSALFNFEYRSFIRLLKYKSCLLLFQSYRRGFGTAE